MPYIYAVNCYLAIILCGKIKTQLIALLNTINSVVSGFSVF